MAGLDNLIKELKTALTASTEKKTSSYNTDAVVRRIEGNTAWVHIPGGVDETPVQLTVNAKVGDTVKVTVGGGRAWIDGNSSAPPTDDTVAEKHEVHDRLGECAGYEHGTEFTLTKSFHFSPPVLTAIPIHSFDLKSECLQSPVL